jgi:hypothetical protein
VSFNDQILIYCEDQSVYLDQYIDFLNLDSGGKAYVSLSKANISASREGHYANYIDDD